MWKCSFFKGRILQVLNIKTPLFEKVENLKESRSLMREFRQTELRLLPLDGCLPRTFWSMELETIYYIQTYTSVDNFWRKYLLMHKRVEFIQFEKQANITILKKIFLRYSGTFFNRKSFRENWVCRGCAWKLIRIHTWKYMSS